MSSTSTTQFYGLPEYAGTDKPDFADTNIPFRDIDAALHGVVQDSEGFATDITNLQSDVTTLNATTEALQTDVASNAAAITAINNKDLAQDAEIAAVDANAKDMICAYNEASATSSHAYAIGDYFIYNNVLYRAIAAINIGDTIVPDTNCMTTNVTSELTNKANISDIDILSAYTYVVGTSSSDSSYLRYRTLGKQIFVEGNIGPIDMNTTLSQYINDGSLPLPDRNEVCVGISGVGLVPLLIELNLAGGLLIASQSALTQNYAVFDFTYFIR